MNDSIVSYTNIKNTDNRSTNVYILFFERLIHQ
jgi:hypothetical protein